MKISKITYLVLFIFFLTLFSKLNPIQVSASETGGCINDIKPPVIYVNKEEWNILIGQDLPNFNEYITVSDSCDPKPILIIDTSYIKNNVVGTYPLFIEAIDNKSNRSMIYVNINVKEDITPPEFFGLENKTHEVLTNLSSDFFLTGVSAIDKFDGDLTSKIIVDYSKVNPNVVGDYEVFYTVTDANYNTITKKIILSVLDTTKPEYRLNPQPIEVLTTSVNCLNYIEVTDNYDLNPSVTTSCTVNTNRIGTYTVVYYLRDRFGNENEAKMVIHVVDTTKPSLEVMNNEIEVFEDKIDWSTMIKVKDNFDPNPMVLVDESNVLLETVGQYKVQFTVIDDSGNTTDSEVYIKVVDYNQPTIENLTNFNILINSLKPNWLENIVVMDNYDQIISNENVIVDDKFVNFTQEGTYKLTYSVMDSSGNSTIETVDIRIYDNVFPHLSGLHNFNIATTSKNIEFIKGITAYDNLNGDITDKILYDDRNVRYNEVGIYKLRYYVSDLSGNVTESFVNVYVNEDLQKPMIVGQSHKTLEIRTTREDWLMGVYSFDDYDKDLTINIDFSQLDHRKLGEQVVTYYVTDDAGNEAREEIIVNVVDTIKPVISGYKNIAAEINSELDLLNGLIVTDNSGEILSIKVESEVDLTTIGKYTVTYTATDSSGNKIIESIFVTVGDTIRPEFEPNPTNKVIEINSSFEPLEGMIVKDNSGEELDINVVSTVDPTKLGDYTVTYSAVDSSGNTNIKLIYISVVDTSKPVFSGVTDQEVKAGKTFNLLEGISAIDNGKDITHKITVSGEYNLKKAGVYQITLTVIDEGQNTATATYTLTVVKTSSVILIILTLILFLLLISVGLFFLNKKYNWIHFKKSEHDNHANDYMS